MRRSALFSRSPTRNATVMLTAAAVTLSSLPGCAFVFTGGPPPPERQEQLTSFDCSESAAPPTVDWVLSGIAGLVARASYDDTTLENPHADAGIYTALAALFFVSASYGILTVARCRNAKAALLARKQRETLLPPPYGLPPWGEPPLNWPPPWAFYRPPAPPAPPPAP